MQEYILKDVLHPFFVYKCTFISILPLWKKYFELFLTINLLLKLFPKKYFPGNNLGNNYIFFCLVNIFIPNSFDFL